MTKLSQSDLALARHLLARMLAADARLARVEQRLAALVRATTPRRVHGPGRRRR